MKTPWRVIALALLCCLNPDMASGQTGLLHDFFSTQRESSVHGHGTVSPRAPTLHQDGVTIQASYTGDMMRRFSGGTVSRRDSYLDNLDLSMTLDTEKMMQWPGGTLFIYGLRNRGGLPNGQHLIGDLQGISNIEAPNRLKLYEAWYRQRFAHDRASLLFGLHNMNSEFYVSNYASLFLNSSFGIGPELSLNVPNPTYPSTGMGVMGRARPFKHWYLQGGIYDGDPGTHLLRSSEGKLIILENGIARENGSYKLGYWRHTASKTYQGRTFANDYGVYALVDQRLFHSQSGAVIGVFVQWGWVPKARNEVTGYLGTGLHIHAPFPGRDEDELGIAVARAGTHQSAETTVELTYRAVVTSWLTLQPSLQWVHHPNGDPSVKAVTVGLLRFQVTL